MNVNELPLYKCHKVVRAGVICSWHSHGFVSVEVRGTNTTFEIEVGDDWIQKHNPKSGGYLVVYEDGYLSYSPASAFEAGYRQLEPVGCSSGSVGGEAAAAPTNTGFQWRKKPVVIEAYQWKESDALNLRGKGWPNWLVAATRCAEDGADQIVTKSFEGYATIKTLEGEMRADIGDWIIRGINGELYPCKPDIFAATYEPADAPVIDLEAADFSDAMMWLKEGKRVQRAGWNGKNQFVVLVKPGFYDVGCSTGAKAGALQPFLALKNAQEMFQPGWIPSMGDLMATDWQVVS